MICNKNLIFYFCSLTLKKNSIDRDDAINHKFIINPIESSKMYFHIYRVTHIDLKDPKTR